MHIVAHEDNSKADNKAGTTTPVQDESIKTLSEVNSSDRKEVQDV